MSMPPKKYPENFEEDVFVNFCKDKSVSPEYHYHMNHYEMCFILSGRVRYIFDYNVYELSPFDMVFINKGVPHKSCCLGEGEHEYVVINFSENYLAKMGSNTLILMETFNTPFQKTPSNYVSDISHLMTKLVFESDYPSIFSHELVDSYIYEFLVILYRITTEVSSERKLPTNGIIEAASKYICQNYAQDITLSEVAQYCHVNKFHLSRLFKEIMGTNLISYLNTIRIHEASTLLLESDLTILDIATSCGFNSLKHFCDVFKRNKGVSAGQFRKQKATLHQLKAESSKMKINFLDGEYWWGGIISKASKMPIDAGMIYKDDIDFDGTDALEGGVSCYLSNKGRYICSDKAFAIEFNKGTILISDESVDVGMGFETLRGAQRAAIKKHFTISDEIPQPEFMQLPQYSTWIELLYNQNEKGILAYANDIVKSDLPRGILMIDEGWSDTYGDFDFSEKSFDNPVKMIETLHSLGFKIMLWTSPFISEQSVYFKELKALGYLVTDKNGKITKREWWNGSDYLLDLSNPSACDWFAEKLDGCMKKYNIEGFKFDAGSSFFYNADDKTFKRQSPSQHAKSFSMFCSRYKYCVLHAPWNMAGAPIVSPIPNKKHSWTQNGLNLLLPETLLQGLCGYYFSCPDMIGGGEYDSFVGDFTLDSELYIRWLEASVLMPMMQFSLSPLKNLTTQELEAVKEITALHGKFSEYILSLAKNASKTGEPIVRMMEYQYPGEGFELVNDQYMLGDDYLVAPVLTKGAYKRSVILPHGKWQDDAGQIYEGSQTVETDAPLFRLPYFKRLSDTSCEQ